MYSCHKNSYLQGNFQHIKAGILNRSIQRAWGNICIDEHDLEPPFNRLTSEQPHIPVENVDVTKRPEGFGRWAMPKLRRELHDKDNNVVIAALTSICDLVHDPERGYEAINLHIVDRLVDLVTNEDPAIRERSIGVLTVLAGLAAGREAIVNNKLLLANLIDSAEDPELAVRMQVAACLEMVARFWRTADLLVEAGYIQVLLELITNEDADILEIQLETLKSLLYCDGKHITIAENGFQTLIGLLTRDEEGVLAKTCQLITLLGNIKEGRKLAQEHKLLLVLNRLLHDERKDVHTAAAEAIMFCTVISQEKIEASKIKSMPKRLVQLCNNRLNPTTQMFALKALTSICEHPQVRNEVREKHLKEIEAVQLGDYPNIKDYKATLVSILSWVPYAREPEFK